MGYDPSLAGPQPGSEHTYEQARRRALVRVVAVAVILAAAAFAVIARQTLLNEPDPTSEAPSVAGPSPTLRPLGIAEVTYPTPIPTLPPRAQPEVEPVDWVRPTADANAIAAALDAPLETGSTAAQSEVALDGAVERGLDPLTIIPSRSRSNVMVYTVREGDNLRTIAGMFGVSENTIIWSNDRFYVNAMRVGLELTILPVDGVYHTVEDPQSITAIAEEYQVNPYSIIDSEFNALYGATPETILPVGYEVVVPGGTGSTEPIYWDPGIVMAGNTSDAASGQVGVGVATGSTAAFAVGDPGSCGYQQVSGGTLPVSSPIYANYRITQDYSWTHGGIDLAVPSGTPVFAAGGGTVIFAGLSTWGYGWTVVIAHGSTLSIYGHLNGDFVGCGEIVSAGQNIAVTGNSGRSSGPHLHFEIRGSGGVPVSPWDYQSF